MKLSAADIGFSLLTGLLQLVARLPFCVLYLLSDITFVLLYFVVRYRRRLVDRNLAASFPELTPGERRSIRRHFYLNFSDYIFETVKLLYVSDAQMRRRMTFAGVDIIDRNLRQGRPVVCYFSHTGNWEWAPSITLWSGLRAGTDAEFCQIYRPLRNRRMDALMLRLRSRFGSVSLAKNMAFLDLMRYRKRGVPTVTGFMSDQKPSHGDPVRVLSFFGRPTAVITGTETLARRLDTAVVYWDMSKPRRGHYHIDVIPMADHAADTEPYELTRRYFENLEGTIHRRPDIWLWTHKRWKTSPVNWEDVDPETRIDND